MYALRRTFSEGLWWFVLVAVAAVLSMMLARTMGAQSPVPPQDSSAMAPIPPMSSAEPWSSLWCNAVQAYRTGNAELAATSFDALVAASPGEPKVVDPALRIWQALAAQRVWDLKGAVAGWEELTLPPETQVWRHLALAAGYLEQGRLGKASAALDAAWDADPKCPVLHYYIGLYNLEEALRGRDWPDAAVATPFRWASFGRPQVVPNSASMYRRAAIEHLTQAVEFSRTMSWNLPLVPEEWTVEPALRPTVGDLLVAIRADHFEGTANSTLANLWLARANGELAEKHLDRAAELGADVLTGYEELARLYESQEKPEDARRAYAKSCKK
jgi:tetratricopeptide (TPR) repeat protein